MSLADDTTQFFIRLLACIRAEKALHLIHISITKYGHAATKTEQRFRRAYHFNVVDGGTIFVLCVKVVKEKKKIVQIFIIFSPDKLCLGIE